MTKAVRSTKRKRRIASRVAIAVFGQTAVEIVHDDDELVDVGGIEQLLEFLPEGMNVLGTDYRSRRCLLDEVARLFGDALDILAEMWSCGLREERRGDIIEALDLIESGDAGRRCECEATGFAGKLQPIDALKHLLGGVGDFCDSGRARRSSSTMVSMTTVFASSKPSKVQPLNQRHRIRVVRPRMRPQASSRRLTCLPPVAMDADRHWCVKHIADQIDHGLRDRLVVQEIGRRLLRVIQEHDITLPPLLKHAKPLFCLSRSGAGAAIWALACNFRYVVKEDAATATSGTN